MTIRTGAKNMCPLTGEHHGSEGKTLSCYTCNKQFLLTDGEKNEQQSFRESTAGNM